MGKAEIDTIRQAIAADIDAHVTERLEHVRTRQSPLMAFFTWCGGISGILSIAGILIFGGRLLQRVDGHDDEISKLDTRVSAVEGNGSRGLAVHVADDDARIAALRERMAAMEKITEAIPRVETATTRNTVILEQLQKQLEDMRRTKP